VPPRFAGSAGHLDHRVAVARGDAHRVVPENGEILWRESGIEETLFHGMCGSGRAADGIRRIDLNQLLENVSRKVADLIVELRGGCANYCKQQQRREAPKIVHNTFWHSEA